MAFLDWLKSYLPEDQEYQGTTPPPQANIVGRDIPQGMPTPSVPPEALSFLAPKTPSAPQLFGAPNKSEPFNYGDTFLRTPVNETNAKAAELIRKIAFPQEQKELMSPAPMTPMRKVSPEEENLEKLLKSTKAAPKPKRSPATETVSPKEEKLTDEQEEALMEEVPEGNTELSDAQKARSEQLKLAAILEGANTIGTAVATRGRHSAQELAPDAFKSMKDLANLKVSEVKERREEKQANLKEKLDTANLIKMEAEQHSEKELADPNSDISKLYQDTIKRDFPNLKTEGISAKNLDAAFGKLLQKAGLEETIANRKEMSRIMADAKKEQTKDKKIAQVEKDAIRMGEDLDPTRFRSGTLKDNQKRIDAAGRVNALFEQFPDYNIPATQTRELSTAVANLLTNGGTTAVTQINELVPHTMAGSGYKMAEWVTNNPTGLQQQKFMMMLHDTAKREEQAAQGQITKAQFEKAYTTHAKLKEKDPETFYSQLSTRTGLGIDEIKTMEQQPGFKGRYIEPKEDMVNVKLPDGRTGQIPRKNLEEAKKKGAVEL